MKRKESVVSQCAVLDGELHLLEQPSLLAESDSVVAVVDDEEDADLDRCVVGESCCWP